MDNEARETDLKRLAVELCLEILDVTRTVWFIFSQAEASYWLLGLYVGSACDLQCSTADGYSPSVNFNVPLLPEKNTQRGRQSTAEYLDTCMLQVSACACSGISDKPSVEIGN